MGYLKYVRQLWKKPSASMQEAQRARLMQWRREPVTLRIEHPTRPDRARSVGYRAKQGMFIVRQAVNRGGHRRPRRVHGRGTKSMRRTMILDVNYQQIAEQRAAKKFHNCEVLNSYWVGEDGNHAWYEIVMVDKDHPRIIADPALKWISSQKHKGRVFRGLTTAGKKSRGLHNKGSGSEKLRPSKTAAYKKKVRRQN